MKEYKFVTLPYKVTNEKEVAEKTTGVPFVGPAEDMVVFDGDNAINKLASEGYEVSQMNIVEKNATEKFILLLLEREKKN